jgi:hypothetical protein
VRNIWAWLTITYGIVRPCRGLPVSCNAVKRPSPESLPAWGGAIAVLIFVAVMFAMGEIEANANIADVFGVLFSIAAVSIAAQTLASQWRDARRAERPEPLEVEMKPLSASPRPVDQKAPQLPQSPPRAAKYRNSSNWPLVIIAGSLGVTLGAFGNLLGGFWQFERMDPGACEVVTGKEDLMLEVWLPRDAPDVSLAVQIVPLPQPPAGSGPSTYAVGTISRDEILSEDSVRSFRMVVPHRAIGTSDAGFGGVAVRWQYRSRSELPVPYDTRRAADSSTLLCEVANSNSSGGPSPESTK